MSLSLGLGLSITRNAAGLGVCSGDSPALLHFDFVAERYYTRTAGQIGVTSHPFADLLTFTGPAGRTYINSSGQLVTAGLNEPRVGNYIDTGSGLFNAGQLFESEDRTQFVRFASAIVANWSIGSSTNSDVDQGFVRLTSTGVSPFPRAEIGAFTAGSGTFTAQAEFREGSSGVAILRFTGTGILGSDTSYAIQFNFSDQSIVYAGGVNPAVEAGFELVSPGVYRVYATVTATTITGMNIYPIWDDNTPGQSVDFRNPQIVDAATPTSFIPNATGSAVTLAGETMQIEPSVLQAALGATMPAAVSISVSGHMTYVDQDAAFQEIFLRWRLDVANEILIGLNTNSAGSTGRVAFTQRATGVFDFVETGITAYAPGTNVPFSIASRHGANFINGSHEGTLLTENTTPTALPNLIGSAFQIAPTFNGNIASLTITAEDLTDAGIQAATTTGSGFNPLCP